MENNYNHFEEIFKRDETELNSLINSLSINLLEGFSLYIYNKNMKEYENKELDINELVKAIKIMKIIIIKIATNKNYNYIDSSINELVEKYQDLLKVNALMKNSAIGTKLGRR